MLKLGTSSSDFPSRNSDCLGVPVNIPDLEDGKYLAGSSKVHCKPRKATSSLRLRIKIVPCKIQESFEKILRGIFGKI